MPNSDFPRKSPLLNHKNNLDSIKENKVLINLINYYD